MEEADVENVIAEEEQENIVNKDPAFLLNAFDTAKFIFEQYGWILLVVVLILIFSKKYLASYFNKWKKKRDEDIYYTNYDNQKSQVTFEAMQKAREKMQNENDLKTEIYLEQVKKREEKKRQMKLERLEGKLSNTSNSQENASEKPKPKKKNLFDGFGPLMGNSGGSTYRPSRRSNTRGG